jgi:N-acylglucosamine-6-phosphate 2-epimerase
MLDLERGLIVSCQAEEGSAFYQMDCMVKFALDAVKGGAVALRVRGSEDISSIKKDISTPVIGLTKSEYPNGDVYITPTYDDGSRLFDSGADYIAMDATGRNGYNAIYRLSQESIPVIGDVSDIKQVKVAIDCGCRMITTALSGYTSECPLTGEQPDYQLLKELVYNFPNIPILAEGRYWEKQQIEKALDIGAYGVVVGSAITRPMLITRRLSKVFNDK